MKKHSVFLIALMLTLSLAACRSNDMPEVTGGTTAPMPTVVTTMPTVATTMPTEDNVPGTSFLPDEDGLIGENDGTTSNTEASERMRIIR